MYLEPKLHSLITSYGTFLPTKILFVLIINVRIHISRRIMARTIIITEFLLSPT
jgi:hypothetical protein